MAEDHISGSRHPVRKLRQYLRPDGRTVHVAASPEEAETLKKKLSTQLNSEEFDLLIHGTPEHLDAIREIHAYHEEQRNALQQQHSDVYHEFERIHGTLDDLSKELNSMTNLEVALDANFSRYGFSAHIRTKELDSSSSSTVSVPPPDKEALRRNGQSMKFWKRPVLRQYFHKGLIWRASATEEVASFELFVDLLYVGIIAINGDRAAEDPTGAALLQFCVTFILSWKLWGELALVTSWFETDDIFQRICVLFFLVCLIGFTTNITSAFDSTYTSLIAFYVAERLFQAIYYVWISYLLSIVRGMMLGSAFTILVGCALWIGSIHVEEPNRQGLIWVAVVWDLCCASLLVNLTRSSEKWETKGSLFVRIAKHFRYYPAVNIEHKTERTNAFVTIVFGYSVVALLYQNKAPDGINAFYGKAVLGLIQAFAFNMIYFEIDSTNIFTHAIRRHHLSFVLWMFLHLPFIMSFILASGALSKLVVAHDCVNADPETLTELYALKSESEIRIGLRWFYCAGLGIALACMAGISFTHIHKTVEDLRFPKYHRLIVRLMVAIILICLPLAESLNSLHLIATTTGLVVFTLAVDLFGSSCTEEGFWRDKRRCRYEAECRLRKQDIEAVKAGNVKVEDVVERGVGEKGGADVS